MLPYVIGPHRHVLRKEGYLHVPNLKTGLNFTSPNAAPRKIAHCRASWTSIYPTNVAAVESKVEHMLQPISGWNLN